MFILTPENLLLCARQPKLSRFLPVLLQIGLVVTIELFDQQTHHTQDWFLLRCIVSRLNVLRRKWLVCLWRFFTLFVLMVRLFALRTAFRLNMHMLWVLAKLSSFYSPLLSKSLFAQNLLLSLVWRRAWTSWLAFHHLFIHVCAVFQHLSCSAHCSFRLLPSSILDQLWSFARP